MFPFDDVIMHSKQTGRYSYFTYVASRIDFKLGEHGIQISIKDST